MAGRGAQGAGRRRAHLRADDEQGRRRLRPLREHALAGLRRRRRRAGDDQRRGRRDRGPARDLPGRAGRDLLLLDLRRAHRGRREERPRHRAAAVAPLRRGPVRQRLAAPPLGPDPAEHGLRGREAARAVPRPLPRRQGAHARQLAPDRRRQRRRLGGQDARQRRRRCAPGSGCSTAGRTSPRSAPARRRRRCRRRRRRRSSRACPTSRACSGRVFPARAGAAVKVQRRLARSLGHGRHRARPAAAAATTRACPPPGSTAIVFRGDAGPAVRAG